MKRMMSIIVSALVAVSFAGIVWAAETSTEGTRSTSDEPRANMPSATSTDTLGTTRKDTGETKRKKKRSTKKKRPVKEGADTRSGTEPHYGTPPLGGPSGTGMGTGAPADGAGGAGGVGTGGAGR